MQKIQHKTASTSHRDAATCARPGPHMSRSHRLALGVLALVLIAGLAAPASAGSSFQGSSFQGSSFQGSSFQGSSFQGSSFQGSSFQGFMQRAFARPLYLGLMRLARAYDAGPSGRPGS